MSATMTSSMPRSGESAASTGRPVRGRAGRKVHFMITSNSARTTIRTSTVGRSAPTRLILAPSGPGRECSSGQVLPQAALAVAHHQVVVEPQGRAGDDAGRAHQRLVHRDVL